MTFDEADSLFGKMLDGNMGDAEIADTLITLAERGESAKEIAGAARAMRSRMIRISAPEGAIDVCGTGGDGQHSLNVSTAVAIVVAACEVPVAKHGNRAASSLAGAADTLEALGLNLDRAMETAEATLADLRICFLFAQKHHPALARLAPIRKSLGRRTIFNLTGPLANPAGVKRQLIGIADPSLHEVYIEALGLLGVERAMVVAGDNGLDEISVDGASTLGQISMSDAPMFSSRDKFASVPLETKLGAGYTTYLTYQFKPEYVGMMSSPMENLVGGDATYNANALRRLLDGKQETWQDHAYRDAVLLNSSASLIVAGVVNDWHEGIEEAAEALDRGLAKTLLDCWVAY